MVAQTSEDGTKYGSVAILGTGWMARALSERITRVAGLSVVLGSRSPSNDSSWDLSGPVKSYQEAIDCATSGIVILAVPASAHSNLAASCVFHGKVVVDISNAPELYDRTFSTYQGPSVAEQLQTSLDSSTQVVKALNTVSAYALGDYFSRGFALQVPVAGNSSGAVARVSDLLEKMRLQPIHVGDLRGAREMERQQFQLFSSWKWPLLVTFIQSIFWIVYSTLWYNWMIFNGFPTFGKSARFTGEQWPMKIFNKICANTGVVNLLIMALAGIVAGVYQLVRRDAVSPFPQWLKRWLSMRKQLGLIALFLICLHVILATLPFGPAYNSTLWNPVVAGQLVAPMMNAYGESMFMIGAIAFMIFVVMGICSLPMMGPLLSYKEWVLVFSWGQYAVILLGFTHAMLYELSFIYCATCTKDINTAYDGFPHNHVEGQDRMTLVPIPRQVMLFAVMLLLFFKLVVALPPISFMLTRLRAGRPAVPSMKLTIEARNRTSPADV